jgi:hypothetical protein
MDDALVLPVMLLRQEGQATIKGENIMRVEGEKESSCDKMHGTTIMLYASVVPGTRTSVKIHSNSLVLTN